MQKRQGSFGLL